MNQSQVERPRSNLNTYIILTFLNNQRGTRRRPHNGPCMQLRRRFVDYMVVIILPEDMDGTRPWIQPRRDVVPCASAPLRMIKL